MTYPHVASLFAQAARRRCDQFAISSVEDLFGNSPSFLELPPAVLSLLAKHRVAAARIVARWAREAQGEPERHPAQLKQYVETLKAMLEQAQ